MAYRFDISAVIKLIIKQLLQIELPLIFYTDSKSLYKYLIKLGTIRERCLIIDVIYIYQLYKHRKIIKIE